jgi:hypothetical protein
MPVGDDIEIMKNMMIELFSNEISDIKLTRIEHIDLKKDEEYKPEEKVITRWNMLEMD